MCALAGGAWRGVARRGKAWRGDGVAMAWRGVAMAWRGVARRGERRACHEMEVAVWFSQSLYMIILAVTVQNVKNT